MNFINFLKEGIKVDGNDHNRFNLKFTQDKATAERISHHYSGKVRFIEDATVSVRWIDQAIEVLSVTTEERQTNLNFWKTKKTSSLIFGAVQTAAALIGIGLMVGAGVVTAGAIPMGVAGVALLITGVSLGILGFVRANQANNQIQAWQDPIEKYCHMRRQIGIQGFPYVQANNLKGTLAHPEEVAKIWIDWSQNFFNKFSGSLNIDEIKQFFDQNPLNPSAHAYAFQTVNIPQHLRHTEQLSQTFNIAKTSYEEVRSLANEQKNAVSDRKNKLLDENEKNRQRALAPAKMTRDFFMTKIQTELAQKTEKPKEQLKLAVEEIEKQYKGKNDQDTPKKQRILYKGKNDQEIQKRQRINSAYNDYNQNQTVKVALNDFNKSKSKYEFIYNLAVLPINALFDGKTKEIKEWASAQINQINAQENQGISNFSYVVNQIAQAFDSCQTYHYSYQDANQIALYPTLAIPSYEQYYEHPRAYNPAWQNDGVNANSYAEFFQELPQYRNSQNVR